MNKTCCIGFATETAIDHLKRPLLNYLKRKYTKAVHELWHGAFMKECTCTNIDVIKRQDCFKSKDSNDIFELGINTIFDKNKQIEELICVTVELDESDDPDTTVKYLNKYVTGLYDFEIDNNGIETEHVNVYSCSMADLFIIINTNNLNGGTVIKMLTDNDDNNLIIGSYHNMMKNDPSDVRKLKNLMVLGGVRSNILLNESLFEAFIEGLLVKHIISECEKDDLIVGPGYIGNNVTTNFLETKSISNVSFDIDSRFVIDHKDLFLKINESLVQNDTYDTVKHTIFDRVPFIQSDPMKS